MSNLMVLLVAEPRLEEQADEPGDQLHLLCERQGTGDPKPAIGKRLDFGRRPLVKG